MIIIRLLFSTWIFTAIAKEEQGFNFDAFTVREKETSHAKPALALPFQPFFFAGKQKET